MSFVLRRGEVVALVGENGSGKTTLAKLLSLLYRPQAGSVRWDAADLSLVDRDVLRGSIAVMFQDYNRYLLTARANVGVGAAERMEDCERIVHAARRAGADEFITRLPRGYDTVLGPQLLGGTDVSEGQWQRLALARAFFRDAPLVILDEPTASLDPRAEAKVFESVRQLFAGRTVLLISHRFSTVRAADRILVLDKGRIIEEGSHAALMARGGVYAELFTLQASAYVDGR